VVAGLPSVHDHRSILPGIPSWAIQLTEAAAGEPRQFKILFPPGAPEK
jgi:hypothetical protein